MVVSSGNEEIGSGDRRAGHRVGRAIGESWPRVNAHAPQKPKQKQTFAK
jgi:hypothetical protein